MLLLGVCVFFSRSKIKELKTKKSKTSAKGFGKLTFKLLKIFKLLTKDK